jgi:hypothetical protein
MKRKLLKIWKGVIMLLVFPLFLFSQSIDISSFPLWDSPDVLIESSLGAYVDFAVDYNYSNGDIYVVAIPDSGTYFGPNYWGILLFRSTNRGETWESLLSQQYNVSITRGKEVDVAVTRADTVYVVCSNSRPGELFDSLNLLKIYNETGSGWTSEVIMGGPSPAVFSDIHSLKLEKDDFNDFYLYMSYAYDSSGSYKGNFLRSLDRGYNWYKFLTTVGSGFHPPPPNIDITVADSTIYVLFLHQTNDYQALDFYYSRNRGNGPSGGAMLSLLDTTAIPKLMHPRIGATTTIPDTGQLVYAFYSQKNSGTGNHDLLYMYSQNGGNSWSSPDTLAKESSSPILSDISGLQCTASEYIDMIFCITTFSSPYTYFTIYDSWTSEYEPTNWQDICVVSGPALNFSTPKMVFSPGSPDYGNGVVFNDAEGNLWFDSPWHNAIPENEIDNEGDKITSKVVLAGTAVEVSSPNTFIYNIIGRKIKKLNTNIWDLTDEKGKKADIGIYFAINDVTGEKVKIILIK